METMQATDVESIVETLKIQRITKRAVPGTWAEGSIGGLGFEALVFEGHAACSDYELGNSRISKLALWELKAGGRVVAGFDRGWDLEPTTEQARRVADVLAAGLAEAVFG